MYNYMWSGTNGMMVFGSVIWILMVVVLVLVIAALWKYINKK